MDGDDDRAMEEAKKVAEAKKLPMAQRVEHKLWKIRAEAYEDMKATCEKIMSDDDPALAEYGKTQWVEQCDVTLAPGKVTRMKGNNYFK